MIFLASLLVITGSIKSVSLVISLIMMAEIEQIIEMNTLIALFILGMMKFGRILIVYYLDVLFIKKNFKIMLNINMEKTKIYGNCFYI